jgi:hypothetical protein
MPGARAIQKAANNCRPGGRWRRRRKSAQKAQSDQIGDFIEFDDTFVARVGATIILDDLK